MRSRKSLWPSPRPLELAFCRYWLRLSPSERRRVVDDLSRPFQRHWYVVDDRGVRRLLPEE